MIKRSGPRPPRRSPPARPTLRLSPPLDSRSPGGNSRLCSLESRAAAPAFPPRADVGGTERCSPRRAPAPSPLYRSIGATACALPAPLGSARRCALCARLRARPAALAPPREVTIAAGPPGASASLQALRPGPPPPGNSADRWGGHTELTTEAPGTRLPVPVACRFLQVRALGAAGRTGMGSFQTLGEARGSERRWACKICLPDRGGRKPNAGRRRLRSEPGRGVLRSAPPARSLSQGAFVPGLP